MTINENSSLLSEKRRIIQSDPKIDDGTQTVISTNDVIIRHMNIILLSSAVIIGGVSKAQYIYKWVSVNTVLPDVIQGVNVSSPGNILQQCATNSSSDAENEYQRLSARMALYFTLMEKIIALPVLVLFGIYSDFIGRKPLMALGALAECAKYGMMSFFIYKDFHINYLFVCYAVSGLGGTYYSFHLANFASVADTTARGKQRSFNIALIDAVIGISGLAAQIAAGYLIKITGFVYINVMVAGLLAMLLLSVICLFKETRVKGSQANSPRSKITWNICDAIKRITGFYTHKEQRRNTPLSIFLTFAFAFIFAYCVATARGDIEVLYNLNFPFCWSSVKIGYYRAVKDFVQMVIGITLIKVLHSCTSDEIISILGCISGIASMGVMAFASKEWMLYLAVGLGIMCLLPLPLIRGIFSKTVLPDKQGALFANIYILEILCGLGGSTIFNNIYAETQNTMKGMAFLVMAGFYFLSGVLLIICLCMTTAQETSTLCIQGNIEPSVNPRSNTPRQDNMDLKRSKASDITSNILADTEELDSSM
ncbi:proton-coupled folate transporter-like [Ylistrum balloti]|uniref:proton-coupled folate transporter-like n=1 Tax=Ylistrum balloti TaxID=509963 RepID=UPI002905ED67|nr:proton-coupled folate transporter-like [Ylistrum balloti]